MPDHKDPRTQEALANTTHLRLRPPHHRQHPCGSATARVTPEVSPRTLRYHRPPLLHFALLPTTPGPAWDNLTLRSPTESVRPARPHIGQPLPDGLNLPPHKMVVASGLLYSTVEVLCIVCFAFGNITLNYFKNKKKSLPTATTWDPYPLPTPGAHQRPGCPQRQRTYPPLHRRSPLHQHELGWTSQRRLPPRSSPPGTKGTHQRPSHSTGHRDGRGG